MVLTRHAVSHASLELEVYRQPCAAILETSSYVTSRDPRTNQVPWDSVTSPAIRSPGLACLSRTDLISQYSAAILKRTGECFDGTQLSQIAVSLFGNHPRSLLDVGSRSGAPETALGPPVALPALREPSKTT